MTSIYDGQLWDRPDVLPHRQYLDLCLRAAERAGGEWLVNTLALSSCSDGTSVAEYVARNPDRFSPAWLDDAPYLQYRDGVYGRLPHMGVGSYV